jgi:hypothetical protein
MCTSFSSETSSFFLPFLVGGTLKEKEILNIIGV